MPRKWLVIAMAATIVLVCIRFTHVRIGWGDYWTVDFVPPWNR